MMTHETDPETVLAVLIFWSLLASPFICYIWYKNKSAKKSLANAEKSRPDFRTFYENYLAQEAATKAEWEREALKGLATDVLLGAIEGTVKGTGETTRRMVRDVTTPAESGVELRLNDIARNLDKK